MVIVLTVNTPEMKIDNVLISLRGFTKAEVKNIIGYLRSVEAHRLERFIFIKIMDPDKTEEEALALIKELWPDPGEPPFTAVLRREKNDRP